MRIQETIYIKRSSVFYFFFQLMAAMSLVVLGFCMFFVPAPTLLTACLVVGTVLGLFIALALWLCALNPQKDKNITIKIKGGMITFILFLSLSLLLVPIEHAGKKSRIAFDRYHFLTAVLWEAVAIQWIVFIMVIIVITINLLLRW